MTLLARRYQSSINRSIIPMKKKKKKKNQNKKQRRFFVCFFPLLTVQNQKKNKTKKKQTQNKTLPSQTIKLQQGLLPSHTNILFMPVPLLPSPQSLLIQGTHCSLLCFFLLSLPWLLSLHWLPNHLTEPATAAPYLHQPTHRP